MSKLLWVALPLLALALYVTVQTWRERPPSRPAFNAASSLLLAAYVITTAALGIFWVANQQLPVFDWHYLFGYATLLLVLLHLVFNLGTAWRQLRRGAVAAPADDATGRRRVATGLGLLLALAGAYLLGLRHGRSELRIAAPAAGPAGAAEASARTLALVERYQAHSAHTRGSLLLRAAGSDWRDPPPRFKRDAALARVPLPPQARPAAPAADLPTLGTLLWHVAGVNDTRGPLPLRCSPSSGALFSTELYLVARAVDGLAPGLWHYDARDHALERLAEAPPAVALGVGDEAAWQALPAALLATAVFGRTGHKYRDRAYRYVLADLGHALENLRVAAAALGLEAPLAARFDEARAAATLGLDERIEGVLALAALRPAAADPAGAARLQAPPPGAAGEPAALAADTPLALTAAMHRLTSWRAAAAPLAMPPPAAPKPALPIALPPVRGTAIPRDALSAIAARRSRRRHAVRPLPATALSELLGALDLNRPALSAALRVDLLVHAASGLPPGAYRYQPSHHVLLPRPASAQGRAASRAAALEQDVIGDAAALLLLSIDRAAFAADAGGPARGWRHAYLEAGLIGERAYLAGGALGLGVCGVGAFYDDEIAALAGLDTAREWPAHLVALGWPG